MNRISEKLNLSIKSIQSIIKSSRDIKLEIDKIQSLIKIREMMIIKRWDSIDQSRSQNIENLSIHPSTRLSSLEEFLNLPRTSQSIKSDQVQGLEDTLGDAIDDFHGHVVDIDLASNFESRLGLMETWARRDIPE